MIINLSNLYPGNIWIKRLGYLVLVYSIGVNCFVGKVQNKIIQEIEIKTENIESSNMLLRANDFPDLEIIKIEKGSTIERVFKEVKSFLENTFGIKVMTVKRINELADLSNNINEESQKITTHISAIKNLLHTVLNIIQITSNLIWLSIIWAIIWLYFDIKKGSVKRFTKIGLLLSIPFNIMAFYMLSNYVNEYLVSFM